MAGEIIPETDFIIVAEGMEMNVEDRKSVV